MPKYYTIDETGDWPAWAVTAWWIKDPRRRAANATQRRDPHAMLSYIAQAAAADDPDAPGRADAHVRRHPVRAGRAGRPDRRRDARGRRAARARAPAGAGATSTRSRSRRSRSSTASTSRRSTRYFEMLANFAQFDLGQELHAQQGRLAAHQGEAAGVDQPRPVDVPALLPDLDPARHRQGGARRHALRHGHHAARAGRVTRCPASRSACC